ncbi:GNAT family N-acetyltransferase [Streptomyces goshikiensis]|uniref:GNAT family N-acetyltransferase n=1 Tax=Streptomyces goshikiensis TaxID=1942 RepID=A0ABZ1RFV7_9ACTN|nr:GNAT family N-acetyltransferase [Streptomyces goshikiensis]
MVTAEEVAFDPEEVLGLYRSVAWEGYTRDVDRLCRGLANSHLVITARDASGTLCGLARTISDDEHICYVQDVVVNPAHHRQGIGRALVEHLMRRYSHCRFFLLSTDHESPRRASATTRSTAAWDSCPTRRRRWRRASVPPGTAPTCATARREPHREPHREPR